MIPRQLWIFIKLAAILTIAASFSFAQQTSVEQPAPEAIIRRFAERESEFHRRLRDHTFKRDIVVQSIAFGGQIAGEYRRISRISFDLSGAQVEHVITAPISRVLPTPEDIKDFATVQTFVIEPRKMGDYDFSYVGRERIDELEVYVFDVKPKVLRDHKLAKLAIKNKDRFFDGRIYIDTQDFQLVKARGRGVPEGKQRYPMFETYREQMDGRYWFPSLTFADDELIYQNGNIERVRLRIKFSDYELKDGKASGQAAVK
jgi:hypothetical protein